MFGGSFFDSFGNDPFFNHHQQQMQRMEAMMRDPFGFHDPFLAITDGRSHPGGYDDLGDRRHAVATRRPHSSMDLMPRQMSDPFGLMPDMFGQMRNMMTNMHRQMEMAPNDPNGHFYSQSTVMSYSDTGNGQPQVYQASSSTRQAPGGVRETRKALRDTYSGVEKMSVGRHMNDQSHVITRQRDMASGHLDENQDLDNLDEDEAAGFNSQWEQRMGSYAGHRHGYELTDRQRYHQQPLALEGTTDYEQQQRRMTDYEQQQRRMTDYEQQQRRRKEKRKKHARFNDTQ